MNLKQTLVFSFFLIHATSGKEILPTIIEQWPSDVVWFDESDHGSINISCKGTGEPAPTYTWRKNDTFENNNSTLLVEKSSIIDGDTFQCFASNTMGVAMSDSIVFRKIPSNLLTNDLKNAIEGDPFKITCNITKDLQKKDNYWAFENALTRNIADEDERITSDASGTLWFSNITTNDTTINNFYVYVIRNSEKDLIPVCKTQLKVSSLGSTSAVKHNSIEADDHYVSEQNGTAEWNKNKKLFCVYGGNSSCRVSWKVNDTNLENDTANIKLKKSGKYIEIENFTEDNERYNYQCDVYCNEERLKTHYFTMKIGTPYFVKEPKIRNETVIENKMVVIDFQIGGFPKPKISFTRNKDPIESSASYFHHMTFNTGEIIIDNVSESDTGNYGFFVFNNEGHAYKNVQLFVQKPKQSYYTGTSEVLVNSSLMSIPVKCPVDGVPPPDIKWMKFRENIKTPVENTNHIQIVSAHNSTLIITNFTSSDIGKYICIAKNEYDKNPLEAIITVKLETVSPVSSTPSSVDSSTSKTQLPENFNKNVESQSMILLILIVTITAILIAIGTIIVYKKYSHSKVYYTVNGSDVESEPGSSKRFEIRNQNQRAASQSNKQSSAHDGTATAEV